ncbi:hypothetical protein HYDPIDRAFT_34095 [Hydnomerulius pinastri MD-312]|uniref:NAD(P)-binding protein n=1 Tax=Hydnomerulius pinastri MD-312 TaxID=994086 RepID=A0A0C9VLM5_9AGAM|nr:hypothetical protein HYDPIDRAFT_34095 [Hydnomerulius pinastri MD-312]
MSAPPKVWFITGSLTGFGREMAELLLRRGNKVIATLRKPEALAPLARKYSRDQLLVLKLDVTEEEEIKSTFAEAHEAFGRIDVVFNSAGDGTSGGPQCLLIGAFARSGTRAGARVPPLSVPSLVLSYIG